MSESNFYEPTMNLRWFTTRGQVMGRTTGGMEWGGNGSTTLQQAYKCKQTGSVEWRDVPVEAE